MFYRATIKQEAQHWLAEFPDCAGCQTFGESREEALEAAEEALTGWLEANLVLGRVPPRPAARRGEPVHVGARLAVVLELRWAREAQGLSQAEVARRAKVSQQQIAKLEDPGANPTLATIEKVARALGQRLELALSS